MKIVHGGEIKSRAYRLKQTPGWMRAGWWKLSTSTRSGSVLCGNKQAVVSKQGSNEDLESGIIAQQANFHSNFTSYNHSATSASLFAFIGFGRTIPQQRSKSKP